MEPQIQKAIERISKNCHKSDVLFVKRKIGEYRINAEVSDGFVKKFIHRQANTIEYHLDDAIVKFNCKKVKRS